MMTVRRLPTFQRYTVDIRLRQFRTMADGKLKIISFNSSKGRHLLDLLRKSGYTCSEENLSQ